MSNYRRAWHKGGTYFFTVNLLERYENDLLVRYISTLRQVIKDVRLKHSLYHSCLGRVTRTHALRD